MRKLIAGLAAVLLLPAVAGASDAEQARTDGAGGQDDPASYLKIYNEYSGKCMGLRRGEMRMIKNTHPDKAIEFRMIRMLAGRRQPGMTQDTIRPEDGGQKLGCELLKDRQQTWQVVRARFVD